jgi:hypothetical protein
MISKKCGSASLLAPKCSSRKFICAPETMIKFLVCALAIAISIVTLHSTVLADPCPIVIKGFFLNSIGATKGFYQYELLLGAPKNAGGLLPARLKRVLL